MCVRNARRSAIDRRGAVTTATHHAPSHVPVAGRRPMSWAALRSSSRPTSRYPSSSTDRSPAATIRDSAVRIVPGAMPNSSPTATSERTGRTGGSMPSRTDRTSERALNGRMPATAGSYCCYIT